MNIESNTKYKIGHTAIILDADKSKKLAEKFYKWAKKYNDNPYDNFNDDEWRLIMQIYRVLLGNEELTE